jgi:hypothetical protein
MPHLLLQDHPDEQELTRDHRFVAMNRSRYNNGPDVTRSWVRNWAMGAHTGTDHWTGAEDLVAKRRSGEVDGVCPVYLTRHNFRPNLFLP